MRTGFKHFFIAVLPVLLTCNSTRADVVDFENAESFGGDDATVTQQYFNSYGLSVSAVAGDSKATATTAVLTYEAAGRDGTDGYWSSSQGRDEAYSGNLGNYFIKAGSGNLSYNKAKYFNMKIDYQNATQKASGEIWDIDGKEQYKVTALDANGNAIASLTSPVGSLNAKPWTWSFDVVGEGEFISSIEVEFVSTQSTLRGFAFDNFNSTEANYNADASTHAAPLPPAFLVGIACLGSLGLVSVSNRGGQKGSGLS